MERLTTNDPQGNVETAHNLFYAKDTEVWVRGGGTAPDYADITLYDFIQQIVQSLGPMSIDTSVPDEELGEELYELLFDGTGTIEGLVATLYTAAWAFADLRNRLAAYEDTGLEPEDLRDYLPMLRTWSQNIGALRYVIELVKAEQEGRLLAMPCKAGDTVYLRDLTPCKVIGISIGHYTRTVTIEFNDGDRIPNWQPRGFDEFGVSVFTTREAAEAALKEREGK